LAGGVEADAGGIAGLRVVLAEHSGAVEYDLLHLGKNLDDLGTPALSWRDLLVIVTHAQPETATFKALNPEWQHTNEVEFLRSIEYRLRWLQWVKTEDAKRHPKSPPEPWALPWDPKPKSDAYKGDAVPIDELNDFLGWTPDQIAQWRGGT
jgi:hypothetical protein